MPVPTSQMERALEAGLFDPVTINQGDFNNGVYHTASGTGIQLPSGNHGVVAYIQVGNDNPLDDAVAAIVGQYLGTPNLPPTVEGKSDGDQFLTGQTRDKRSQFRIKQEDDTDYASGTRVAVATAKQEFETKPRATDWRDLADMDPNNVTNINEIPPTFPHPTSPLFVGENEYINIVVDAGSTAQRFGFDHSTVTLYALKWDGKGL